MSSITELLKLSVAIDAFEPMALVGSTRNAAGDIQLTVGKPPLMWHSPTKSFSIDASDIRWDIQRTVSITNPKTGGVALYTHPIPTKDGEGEVMYWTLSGPHSTWLKIFND